MERPIIYGVPPPTLPAKPSKAMQDQMNRSLPPIPAHAPTRTTWWQVPSRLARSHSCPSFTSGPHLPVKANVLSRTRSTRQIPAVRPSLPDTRSLAANSFEALFSSSRIAFIFLEHTCWRDFYALTCTCRTFHYMLNVPSLKDIVLSEFVPGYREGLQIRDLQRYQDVPVTLHDLDMLRMSLQYPEHHYPSHALNMLSGSPLIDERARIMNKLVTMAQAHSRFVLLLQSLVHSSSAPLPPELVEPKLSVRATPSVRELVFPPPLSYARVWAKEDIATAKHNENVPVNKTLQKRKERASFVSAVNVDIIATRRLSIFGKTDKPHYPPPTQTVHSGSWRRTLSQYQSKSQSRRKFPLVESPTASTDVSGFTTTTSPHDLRTSLSRTRAPLLRVFLPCCDLSLPVIQACEDQLAESGLWDHLSAGDVVCNFGFVPINPVETPNEYTFTEFGALERSRNSGSYWLIYNGDCLVPFSPPQPLPLEDPLSLPSPFYFNHIIPTSFDPIFNLRLPANHQVPQLTLTRTSTKVPSPHSVTGYAVVKRYAWLARVLRPQLEGMGEGWQGHWVLEAEGTKEGHQTILDSLRGNKDILWACEIVREKCSGRRLWLRLISSCRAPVRSM